MKTLQYAVEESRSISYDNRETNDMYRNPLYTLSTMYNIFHVIVFSVSLRNSIDSNLRFAARQSTVTMVFTRWPREDSFPVSQALGGKCRRLCRVCNIMLQDLTPLHVKITRSTNLLRVCRRKFKLSTFLHTVSDNRINFLNTRSQVL